MDAWHPIVPSHELESGDCIVQAFADGIDFALWRSRAGAVQAWENRCAHRSVRLSLGRVIDDQLACGYHGWRYAPGGQCTYRPSNPRAPAPKGLGIRTFPAVEVGGMVWVASGAEAPAIRPPFDIEHIVFCRSFVVRSRLAKVADALSRRGRLARGHWAGKIDELPAAAYVLAAKADRTVLHVWCHQPGDALRVSAAFRKLRDSVERS